MNLLLLALLIFVATGFLALCGSRWPRLAAVLGAAGMVAGALAGLLVALSGLRANEPQSWTLAWGVPGGHLSLYLDPLAAFFLLPMCLLALLCALYAPGYLQGHAHPAALGPHWFFLNMMVAAMILVVVAANAVLFLMAWEVMTLTSFFLVAFEHRQAEVREAAWLYLVVAHLGLVLLLAFFVGAGTLCGSFDFAAFGCLSQLSSLTTGLLFVAALAGFGVKAGLFPLHVWLPDAHPAAPSHVSALMSGVLVKIGIYGILRVGSFLPAALPLAGVLLMALGGAGALYGIVMANFQRDIKRCLAYSTIENVGIIFLGLGLGFFAQANGHPTLALFGFAGGLLHIWNHALFKGLLFLGAGSVLHATGTRDMDQLGGLLKRMPWTGGLLLGGCLAIAALPPFNGLVSEWLIYLGLLQEGVLDAGFSGLLSLLLVGLLGLVGALAVLAFTRLAGIVLLGSPRSLPAEQARESSLSLLGPMGALLAGCLFVGVFPQGALSLLALPLEQLVPGGQAALAPVLLRVGKLGQFHGLIGLSLLVIAALLLWLRHHRPVARRGTWSCGFAFSSSRGEYTGEGYAELTQSHLVPHLLAPQVNRPLLRGVFPGRIGLSQQSLDPVLTRLFLPGIARVTHWCVRLRWLQQGRLHVYLLYIFMACTLLLAWGVWAGRGVP
ncbi:MAG: proton-conducting transporter membrane subunit [Desulfuromonadales bacterium]|nr:proton-conducting transporter membrane subunit [Desulfuromonadales bacterium]MDW7756622.1 proton-conducting transporter membrane subunit [Desulfuromonadales bacterium]